MANPNPVVNMNIGQAPKPGAVTEIGKFKRDMAKFNRANIPTELLELYDFYRGIDTGKINYILELKNLYKVLQAAMLPALIEKLTKGEVPNARELNALKLLKDIMAESHKLKYGDKKVIENIVTVADIRNQMRSDKTIINVTAIKDKTVEDVKKGQEQIKKGEVLTKEEVFGKDDN